MPLDFPASPAVDETFEGPSGQIWLWDGEKWTFGGGESAPVTVSPTEPTNPGTGDLWFDPTDDNLYVFDGTNWVAVSGSGTAVEITDTPPANPEPGQMYWDTTTAKLFLWDGLQWIAVINTPNGGGGGGAAIDIDENPPTNPTTGMLWWATDVAKLFFWDGTEWVIVVNTPEGGGGGSGPVTGTGATVLNQSPTINQPLLMGVTDGSDATAYEIGEYFFMQGQFGYSPFLYIIDNSPPTVILNMPITPGDWDVQGGVANGNVVDNASVMYFGLAVNGNQIYTPGAVGSTGPASQQPDINTTGVTRISISAPSSLQLQAWLVTSDGGVNLLYPVQPPECWLRGRRVR